MTSSGLDGTHSLADSTNNQQLMGSSQVNSCSENSSMTNTITVNNVDVVVPKPKPRLYQRQPSFVHKSVTFETSLNSLSYLNARGATNQPEVQRSLLSYTAKQLWILAAVAYGNFWVAACVSLQAPFFPEEAENKGASSTVYGLVFGIYELVIFVMSPIFSKIIPFCNPNRLVTSGLLVSGVMTIMFGLLDKLPDGPPFISMAFVVRVAEGVGAAAFMTASYTIMSAEFSERIATTFALLETCFGLGLILGPTVGGALYGVGGYWLPFISLGSFLLLGGFVTCACLPKQVERQQAGGGSLLKFLADWSILLDAFGIASSLNFIGFNAATLEPHLRQFELTPFVIGSVFVLTGLVYALTSPIFGKLCDIGFNEKTIMLVGSLLCIIGSVFIGPLPFFAFDSQLWITIVSLVVIGFGMSAKLVASFVDAINYSTKRRQLYDDMTSYSMVSAMFFSFCSVGAFTGPVVGGALLDWIDYRESTIYLVIIDIVFCVAIALYKLLKRELPLRNAQDNARINAHVNGQNTITTSEIEPLLSKSKA